MGKKKGSKGTGKDKSKKKKSSKNEASPDQPPVVTLQHGNGKFKMENGDIYDGDYCAHRVGIVWREGYGIYRTHDGQIYRGFWKDDVLINDSEAVIKFPNRQQYRGRVIKNKANGPGVFVLENSMEICCEFIDNKPVGHIILIDLFGHVWEGEAEKNTALLFPENIFYKVLTPDCGKGELIVKKKAQKKKPPPLALCKPDENILLMSDIGGYIFTRANKERFPKENDKYFNKVASDTQIPKPPKQLESEFISYERVFGVRRRFTPKPIQQAKAISNTESLTDLKKDSKSVSLEKTPEIVVKEDSKTIEEKREELTITVPDCALDVEEMEKIVFAKSTKTSYEGVFSYEEKYVQDYLKFRKRKAEIYQKIEEIGEDNLDDKDGQWLIKYRSFVRHMKSVHSRRKHMLDKGYSKEEKAAALNLLKEFFSKEWRERVPTITVFKPTQAEENE